MRLFFTIEFIALLLLVVGYLRDYSYWHDFNSTDDGWTTSYRYNAEARKLRNILSYIAAIVSIVGFLVLIWTINLNDLLK